MSSLTVRTVITLSAALFWLGGACGGLVDAGTGSETNWIMCHSDADCSAGQCICGMCASGCGESAGCAERETCAIAGSSAFHGVCSDRGGGVSGLCLKMCASAADCNHGFRCADGACLPNSPSGALATESSAVTYSVERYVLASADVIGQCVRPPSAAGSIRCSVMEYTNDGECDCSGAGYSAATEAELEAGQQWLKESEWCAGGQCESLCGCKLEAFAGSDAEHCREDQVLSGEVPGWCYLDADQVEAMATLEGCTDWHPALVRFHGVGANDSALVVRCEAVTPIDSEGNGTGAIGAPCVPADEHRPEFPGYFLDDVALDTRSSACESGLCLVNRFQGRVDCPYDMGCTTPGGEPLTVAGNSQSEGRPPEDAVYCSCRCGGPEGTGPFCDCPTGFECAELIDDVGLSSPALTGSFCIKEGTGGREPAGSNCDPIFNPCSR